MHQRVSQVFNQLGEIVRDVDRSLITKELRYKSGYPPPETASDKTISALRGEEIEDKFIELYQKAF